MAENKKSFVLYCDLIHTIKKLSNDKAGEVFKHILSYVNDENPQSDDTIVDLVFEPIKQQLKRDLIKFEEAKDKKSYNGRIGNLKRWNLDLYEKVLANEMKLEEAETIALHRKASQPDSTASQSIAVNVNDNVSVNESVNANVNVINKNQNDVFFSELINSESWIETSAMQSKAKFKPLEVKEKLKEYNTMLEVTFDIKINKNEYATHFIHWLNKQEKKDSKEPAKKLLF